METKLKETFAKHASQIADTIEIFSVCSGVAGALGFWSRSTSHAENFNLLAGSAALLAGLGVACTLNHVRSLNGYPFNRTNQLEASAVKRIKTPLKMNEWQDKI